MKIKHRLSSKIHSCQWLLK